MPAIPTPIVLDYAEKNKVRYTFFFIPGTGYEKSQKYAILDADSQSPRRRQSLGPLIAGIN